MSDIAELWLSGFVRRWHMNPSLSDLDDYTCAHQGRCAMLVIALFPDHSHDLLRAAVTHDGAEVRVGDLSAPFKDCAGDLVQAHAALEHIQLDCMGLRVDLVPDDWDRLKLVDRLDAYLFIALRRPTELHQPDWRDATFSLEAMAGQLGVHDQVFDLLVGCRS